MTSYITYYCFTDETGKKHVGTTKPKNPEKYQNQHSLLAPNDTVAEMAYNTHLKIANDRKDFS